MSSYFDLGSFPLAIYKNFKKYTYCISESMYIVKRKKTEFKKQRVHMQADGAMKLCELTFPDLQSFLRLHINSSIYSTRAFTFNLSEVFFVTFPNYLQIKQN